MAIAVGEGQTNKQAAVALFLSPKTIEFHLGHIYRKLGVHTRKQLARAMLAGPQTRDLTTSASTAAKKYPPNRFPALMAGN